jgi:HK97 family phage prohead protease
VRDPELRGLSHEASHLEIRADDEVEGERFVGHAAVFDTRTAIGNPLKWGFYEEIKKGAFTKTLGEADARMLIDHNPSLVVSRMSADTLNLSQDNVGLAVDSALDTELSYVNDLKANLRNGNITGMSFGFFVVKDSWATEKITTSDGNEAEVEVRVIEEVRLVEVSAVTFPAYEDTDAGMRSVERALRARGDLDAITRRLVFRPELAVLLDELDDRADDPKKPYGNVKYADPGYQKDGKKRYPIDTKDHCLAAWSYINQDKNAKKYTSAQLKLIKGRIKAALKKFGVDVDEKKSWDLDALLVELLGERDVESAPESTVDDEPAETTQRSEDENVAPDEAPEPAEPTRNAPSDAALANARLRVLHAQLRQPAA